MIRRLSALLSAFLVLAGCSEAGNWPVAPGETPVNATFAGITVNPVLEFAELPNLSSGRHAEKWITAAEGGSVQLNGFRVDIPAGALPYDALVTIDLPTDETLAKRVLAEFGPHGIQFNTPVSISFPLEGTLYTGGAMEVARWEDGAWNRLGGGVSADGTRVTGTTPHFSAYATVSAGG